MAHPAPAKPSGELVRRIIAEEAAVAGIDPALVSTKLRTASVSWARARACKRLLALGYGYSPIGHALGLHHTSVMHSEARELPEIPSPSKSERAERAWIKVRPITKPVSISCVPDAPTKKAIPSEIAVTKDQLMGHGREWAAKAKCGGNGSAKLSHEAFWGRF